MGECIVPAFLISTLGRGECSALRPYRFTSGLRLYTASRKVSDLSPDVVIDLLSNYLILPAAQGPRVYSLSNRNEYQKML
jgi:hypothetical protein